MKKTLLIVSATIIQLFCVAQKSEQYDLLLSNGAISLPANFDRVNSQTHSQGEIFNGNYYRYIQFYGIPSTEQKKQLIEKGVDLLLYLPTNTFIASIKQNVNFKSIPHSDTINQSPFQYHIFPITVFLNLSIHFAGYRIYYIINDIFSKHFTSDTNILFVDLTETSYKCNYCITILYMYCNCYERIMS